MRSTPQLYTNGSSLCVGRAHDPRPLRSSQAWFGRAPERLARRLQLDKTRFGYRPTAELRVIQGCAVLHITWLGNLRLPKIENGQLSADRMVACLWDWRRGAAEHIVPQAGPSPLPEMRCLDPNTCSCLDHGNTYGRSPQWSLTGGWAGRDPTLSCRVAPSRRLLPPATPSNRPGNESGGVAPGLWGPGTVP